MNKGGLFPATAMPDKDWWHTLWPDPSQVLRDVGIATGMRVVDLCCGDGYFTLSMCELSNSSDVYGLDIDDELLAQAEAACGSCDNFHAIRGDALDLPKLLDGPVDFVFMANTFHGVPDQLDLSRAVHEVLSGSGQLAIVNWHRKPREETTVLDEPRGPDTALRMQPEDVRVAVEPAGFRLDKVVDVGPYHYGAVFSKTGNGQTTV